jgi:YD repeat-containing protein
MKTFTAIIAFALLFVTEASPQNFSFSYDQAGNRTTRSILLSKSTSALDVLDSVLIQESKESEKLIQVTLYPNPTKDDVFIHITNKDENIPSKLFIYDSSGRLINSLTNISDISSAGLTGLPTGNYFLIIEINGNTSRWKIVKQE